MRVCEFKDVFVRSALSFLPIVETSFLNYSYVDLCRERNWTHSTSHSYIWIGFGNDMYSYEALHEDSPSAIQTDVLEVGVFAARKSVESIFSDRSQRPDVVMDRKSQVPYLAIVPIGWKLPSAGALYFPEQICFAPGGRKSRSIIKFSSDNSFLFS